MKRMQAIKGPHLLSSIAEGSDYDIEAKLAVEGHSHSIKCKRGSSPSHTIVRKLAIKGDSLAIKHREETC